MAEETKEILALFDDASDVENLTIVLDSNIGNVPLGMTGFQIDRFVLNKREFPTDLMQFQQAKLEIYTRVQALADLYFQYREAEARIKLAGGRIEQIGSEPAEKISWSQAQAFKEVREAKIDLQRIEIEKNQFKMKNLQHLAKVKLSELLAFYKTYEKFRHFESMEPEELAKLEEEGWRIKSAYYPELPQRYNLTPQGFVKLPHEDGGLKKLLEVTEEFPVER